MAAARFTRVLASAATGLLAFAVSFGFAEVIVRLLYKSETTIFPRYHTDYRYGRYTIRGVRPKAEYWHTSIDGSWKFVTNERGFRDAREFTYVKPSGTFRVLSLGDSQTQGYEVRQDHTFSAVLERSLHRRGKPAQVINSGVSGFGTAEALVLLENEGIRYEPDVVLLGFFANDFEDNVKSSLFDLDEHDRLVEKRFDYVPGVAVQNLIYSVSAVRWLSENSYFYSLLFNNVWIYFKSRMTEAALQGIKRPGVSSPQISGSLEYAVPTAEVLQEYQIALAAKLIERMHDFCVARGVRLIVLDVPTRSERFVFKTSLPPLLRQRLEKASVEYIASESVLGSFQGIADVHVPNGQVHMSELAHVLIAREVSDWLFAAADAPGHN